MDFKNKAVGIWGAGIVGKSAIKFFQQEKARIQLLNKTTVPDLDPSIEQLEQTPKNITAFFEHNDYILPSPGIPLHEYAKYHDKIITEADILHDRYTKPIIAITGTAGKTTVTHLLGKIFNEFQPTIAAGNIGYPMLNLLTKNHGEELAIIELSSFQLQHTKQFAPDLAVITNFYPNHLDYHKDEQEYRTAKEQIFRFQTSGQKQLLPETFSDKKPSGNVKRFIFSKNTKNKEKAPCYLISENKIIYSDGLKKVELAAITKLPPYTFPENWLIITTVLHLHGITITDALCEKMFSYTLPDHRLAPLCTIGGTTFYNDSKSTIWQATAQAIDQVEKPTALFLGGLSKNIDRSPLIEKIKNSEDITVFAFGKEAQKIKDQCVKKKIPTFSAATLEESFQQCMNNLTESKSVLFSPGGSSFDLFKNFEERGKIFESIVQKHTKK